MRGKAATIPFLTVVLVFSWAGTAAATECYFLMVFGSQRPAANLPPHTHSFATFIKAVGEGPNPERYALQTWTISWMPASLKIEFFRLTSDCGINLSLEGTLRWAAEDGQRTSMWGPYQVDKELFDRALGQIAHLQSGTVAYKLVDAARHTDRVSNCIHAVSNLSTDNSRMRCGPPGWGESASYLIVLHFMPWIIDCRQTHAWILQRMGLECYPLVHRDLSCNPTKNPALRLLQSGAHRSLEHRLPH
jgi:hypothetical protein